MSPPPGALLRGSQVGTAEGAPGRIPGREWGGLERLQGTQIRGSRAQELETEYSIFYCQVHRRSSTNIIVCLNQ